MDISWKLRETTGAGDDNMKPAHRRRFQWGPARCCVSYRIGALTVVAVAVKCDGPAAGGEALGAGKAFHPKLPPAYDGDRSWSAAALPYRIPCWNTADDPTASFQDGGLPCVPCAIDVEARLFHNVNLSIANEFCETAAFEAALTVDDGLALLRGAHRTLVLILLCQRLRQPLLQVGNLLPQLALVDRPRRGPREDPQRPLQVVLRTDSPMARWQSL